MSRQTLRTLTYILQALVAFGAVLSLLGAAAAMEKGAALLWVLNFGFATANIYLFITLGKARKDSDAGRKG